MKIRNLKIYQLKENGTLEKIGDNKTATIKREKYNLSGEKEWYEIEEPEYILKTDYTKCFVKERRVIRLHKQNNFRCEMCVKLNWFQGIKYELPKILKSIPKLVFKCTIKIIKFFADALIA